MLEPQKGLSDTGRIRGDAERTLGIGKDKREQPNSRKDFGKMLEKEAQTQETAVQRQKAGRQKARDRSIFDPLDKKQHLAKARDRSFFDPLDKKQHLEKARDRSFFESLDKNQHAQNTRKTSSEGGREDHEDEPDDDADIEADPRALAGLRQALEAHGDLAGIVRSTTEEPKPKERIRNDYTQASSDLSYVNPQPGKIMTFEIEGRAGSQAPEAPVPIKQLAEQIVDKLTTLKLEGRTETVLSLKHPPILEGSEIVLTSFDHARGEFNISMHNLTQAAERFLLENNVRLGLKQALEESGYTVHIMTLTSEPYQVVMEAEPRHPTGEERQEERRQSQQEEHDDSEHE